MNKKQIIIDYEEYLEMENLIKYYKESERNYCKYMDNATTEVEEYKKIIDKAKEFIEQYNVYFDDDLTGKSKGTYIPKELLNILQGSDKE